MRRAMLLFLVSIILCSCAITPQNLPELYKQNISAVVSIYVERIDFYSGEQEIRFNGSGFIIDKEEGLIVTAAHVVKNSEFYQVELNSGELLFAKIFALDIHNDIAILKINSELLDKKSIPILQLKIAPAIGQCIFSIGRPNNFKNTVSLGILSHGLFRIQGFPISFSLGVYLGDFHGFGGSSGCPVFNLENKIIGMAVGTSANFVVIVPANSIDKVLKDFSKD